MKGFIGKATFSGLYDENLDNVLSIFGTLLNMCAVTQDANRQAVPAMLNGDVLAQLARKRKDCTTYQQGNDLLRNWYN